MVSWLSVKIGLRFQDRSVVAAVYLLTPIKSVLQSQCVCVIGVVVQVMHRCTVAYS